MLKRMTFPFCAAGASAALYSRSPAPWLPYDRSYSRTERDVSRSRPKPPPSCTFDDLFPCEPSCAMPALVQPYAHLPVGPSVPEPPAPPLPHACELTTCAPATL